MTHTVEDFIVPSGQSGTANEPGDFKEVPVLSGYFDNDGGDPKTLITTGYPINGGSFDYILMEFLDGWSDEAESLVENVKFIPRSDKSGEVYLVADLKNVGEKKLGAYRLLRWTKHIQEKVDSKIIIIDHLYVVFKGDIKNNAVKRLTWPWDPQKE